MHPVRLLNGQLYAPPGCCSASSLRGWAEVPIEMKVATVAGLGLVAFLGVVALAGRSRR